MTGITKDELMQMAREVGLDVQSCPWTQVSEDWVEGDAAAFESFANAILERAAVECDNAAAQSGNTAKESAEIKDFGSQLVAEGAKAQASKLAQHFRALKINTGD